MRQPSYRYFYQLTDVPPKADIANSFKGDMKSLFLLSLLLTGETGLAESCFLSTLDDCMSMKPSVTEWTNGWTRYVLVQNAIAILQPAMNDEEEPVSCNVKLNPALRAVMRLHSFERFVFVLSILEGYSNHECSVLLGPSVQEITAVKIRALKNLAAAPKSRLLDQKASGYWADTLTASNAGFN